MIAGNPQAWLWLWLVAAVTILLIVAALRRRGALRRFAAERLWPALISRRERWSIRAALVLLSLLMIVAALLDLRWGRRWREIPQRRAQVVVLLDVSRSMLARDVSPSRLERARLWIGDLLAAADGDRVGFVAYAGEARQLVPLTTSYDALRQNLETVGPASVARGGSRLAAGLEAAGRAFVRRLAEPKVIVVLSDGEEHSPGAVAMAVAIHAGLGARIVTIGLGDPNRGALIPVRDTDAGTEYLKHGGDVVRSRMQPEVLAQVARAGDGLFVAAETKQVDVGEVYRTFIAPLRSSEGETVRIREYVSRYRWFLGAALLMLLVEILLPPRAVGRKRPKIASRTASQASLARAGAWLLALGLVASPASASDLRDAFREADRQLEQGNLTAALEAYRRAAELAPERYEPVFNQGVVHYRLGDWNRARARFAEALATRDEDLERRAHFNLGNCEYAEVLAGEVAGRDAAEAKLRNAIGHYRNTLAIDPSYDAARTNIQLARMLMDRMSKQSGGDDSGESDGDGNRRSAGENGEEPGEADQSDRSGQRDGDGSPGEPSGGQENQNQEGGAKKPRSNSDGSPKSPENGGRSALNDRSSVSPPASSQQKSPDEHGEARDRAGASSAEQKSRAGNGGRSDRGARSDAGEKRPDQRQTEHGKQENRGRQQGTDRPSDRSPERDAAARAGGEDLDEDSRPERPPPDWKHRPLTRDEAERMLREIRERDYQSRREQQIQREREHVPVERDW